MSRSADSSEGVSSNCVGCKCAKPLIENRPAWRPIHQFFGNIWFQTWMAPILPTLCYQCRRHRTEPHPFIVWYPRMGAQHVHCVHISALPCIGFALLGSTSHILPPILLSKPMSPHSSCYPHTSTPLGISGTFAPASDCEPCLHQPPCLAYMVCPPPPNISNFSEPNPLFLIFLMYALLLLLPSSFSLIVLFASPPPPFAMICGICPKSVSDFLQPYPNC